MKKKLLVVIMTVCLAIVAMTVMAFADVTIGDYTLTDGSTLAIGGGTATYKDGVLTLNNFTFSDEFSGEAIHSSSDLIIAFSGVNNISVSQEAYFAIIVDGLLTLQGEEGAILNVTATSISEFGVAIYAQNINISGGTVNATADIFAIRASSGGSISITDSTVTATSQAWGIVADGSTGTVTISDSVVTIYADAGTFYNTVISGDANFTFYGNTDYSYIYNVTVKPTSGETLMVQTGTSADNYTATCYSESTTIGTMYYNYIHIETHEHSYTDVVTKEATCTEDGEITYTCSVCGDSYTEAIAAIGHAYGEPVIENEVEATCTTDGSYDTVVYCTVCGEEVSRETVVIPATGHTEAEAVTENEVEATCTTDGSYDTVIYCSVCGEEISRETTTVPATGHSYEAVVTDPTCTEGGYTTYTCSVCGDSYVDDYTEALGHSYEAVVTEPTCTEGGYTTYTCSVCGDSYVDDYTEALGHSYEAVVTDPTCTEGGYTTYTCSVCGDTYVADETEALGHTYGEPVWTWDTNGGATATFTCVNDPDHVEVITATITAVGNLGVVTKTATVEFNGVTYTSDPVTTGTKITIPQSTSPAVTTEETTIVEESVTIDEPVEDTDTDDEPDEMEVSEPVEEPEPEENPTTGIALALLPMAIAIAGAVAGKRKV